MSGLNLPKLSLVVVSFEMHRELPRTLRSLSPAQQVGVTADDYEVIVVDNGSQQPPTHQMLHATGAPVSEVLVVQEPTVSPVPAANVGLAAARGGLVGVLIDGARLASPGLLHYAMLASRLQDRVAISPISYHLGPAPQSVSITEGYDQAAEDELLASVSWESAPYRLFEISVFANSSANGWFGPLAESNAFFMPSTLWSELGGYDEGFRSPGGGLANLDVYARACELPDVMVVTLLGEGTFHQVHGGVATNSTESRWPEFHREYVELRGEPFVLPAVDTVYVGRLPRQAVPHLERSVRLVRKAVDEMMP